MQKQPATDTGDQEARFRWEALGAAILILGIAFQLLITLNELVLPVGEMIWEVRDKPAWERTGTISAWAGKERTAFLGFLRGKTPTDATVVFFEEHGLYSWWPALQYFLFPRHIQTCSQINEECWQALPKGSVYFVSINGRPAKESLPYRVDFIPYQEQKRMGLYTQAPDSKAP